VRRLIACVAFFALAACGSGSSKLGPLLVDPPDGWLVTDRTDESIKITNGSIADDESTKPGTATAVFDIYVNSTQTSDEFVEVLRDNNVKPEIEHLQVDGWPASLVSYESGSFGPSSDVLFVDSFQVRAVYRAAFPDAESAFARHRSDFRETIATIRFPGGKTLRGA
jgi:hypothetical protein